MAELTEEQIKVLKAIGLKGATLGRIVADNIDQRLVGELVESGHVEPTTIELHETQGGALAVQASPGIQVYMLTPAGAIAIGENPSLIGRA
jgi:hypothetical protein